MSWITPKTNWKPTDYFNLDPDYNRIKGNIEYLFEYSKKLYVPPDIIPMGEYNFSDDPYVEFFNNIVDNTKNLADGTFVPDGFYDMPRYTENNKIWTENELNAIEKNQEMLYNSYKGQFNLLPMLEFELGGTEF